jgi:hypothetical protein
MKAEERKGVQLLEINPENRRYGANFGANKKAAMKLNFITA